MRRIRCNEEICMACHLCEVNCLVAHSRSRDYVKAYKKEVPRLPARVRVEEEGPSSFPALCHHCEQPVCVYSCIAGALSKNPVTGVVTIDQERCVGCWTCVMVCPHNAIMPDGLRGKAEKCDLCAGRESPACVAGCPNEALVYSE